MNREQVMELMRSAGAGYEHPKPNDYEGVVECFAKFAGLVAGAEREACVKAGQEIIDLEIRASSAHVYGACMVVDAIRARNTDKETK